MSRGGAKYAPTSTIRVASPASNAGLRRRSSAPAMKPPSSQGLAEFTRTAQGCGDMRLHESRARTDQRGR
jgi:hypothetical protein